MRRKLYLHIALLAYDVKGMGYFCTSHSRCDGGASQGSVEVGVLWSWFQGVRAVVLRPTIAQTPRQRTMISTSVDPYLTSKSLGIFEHIVKISARRVGTGAMHYHRDLRVRPVVGSGVSLSGIMQRWGHLSGATVYTQGGDGRQGVTSESGSQAAYSRELAALSVLPSSADR